MKIEDIKKIAASRSLDCRSAKTKTELVRLVQTAEANNPCFNTGSSQICGQEGCLWRGDCK